MELGTRVIGGKTPRDGAELSIALGLQGDNTLAQVLHAFYPTRQTASRKDTDLNLGHIQPTAMDGGCNGTRLVAGSVGPRQPRRLHTAQRPYGCSDYPGRCECIPPADRLH